MKIEFQEGQYGSNITLTPETPQEVAKLARVAKSSKKQTPSMHFSFSGDPYLNIHFKKIDTSKQDNSISNK